MFGIVRHFVNIFNEFVLAIGVELIVNDLRMNLVIMVRILSE